jgi:acyl-CoA synthetase (AMP-forming)/AMP-acid ligase II
MMDKFADLTNPFPSEGLPFIYWHQQIRHHAATNPQKIALRYIKNGREPVNSLTYAEFDRLSRSAASHLQQTPRPSPQAIVICEDNLWFMVAMSACFYAGITAIPAAPPMLDRSMQRLSVMLLTTGAQYILTTSELYPLLERACKREFPERNFMFCQIDTFADVADTWVEPSISPESIAYLQYTSGSISDPRGVIISHRQLILHLQQIKAHLGFDPCPVSAGWLPLHHDFGLIIIGLLPLFYGGTSVSMSPQNFIQNPRSWLWMLSQYQAQLCPTPEFGFLYCLSRLSKDSLHDVDLTHLTSFIVGGEPNQKETVENFLALTEPTGLTQAAIKPTYGMAEAVGGISSRLPDHLEWWLAADATALNQNRFVPALPGQPFNDVVTCGTPLAGVRIVVVHPETHQKQLQDQVGEIWVSGLHIGTGYHNNPQATEAQFQAKLGDEDTLFLRTGDLGFIHGQQLYITGRLKEMMIIHGKSLYPQDFEAVAEATSPLIRLHGSCVFSIRLKEEVVVIIVEVRQSLRDDIETLKNLAANIAFRMIHMFQVQPYQILLVRPKTIPRTTSGKRQRMLLRQQYERGEILTLYSWKRPSTNDG